MDEEALVQLGKFALNETSTDNVDDPELNFLLRNVETAGNGVVREGAVFAGGSEGGKGEEANLAVGGVSIDACEIVSLSPQYRDERNQPLSSAQVSCSSLNSM